MVQVQRQPGGRGCHGRRDAEGGVFWRDLQVRIMSVTNLCSHGDVFLSCDVDLVLI